MSPQPAAPPRRLVRRTDDRILAGVASGLADLLGVDPVLVRVGFVLLAFAGGAGVIAYLLLWLLTPEGSPGGPRPVPDRTAAFWVAIGLFVLAALAVADTVGERSIVWPLVLIGAGVALWRSDRSRSSRPAGPAPGADATENVPTATATGPAPPAAGAVPSRATGAGAHPPAPATEPAWSPPPPPGGPDGPAEGDPGWSPPRRRERSILGRLTLGVALVTVGLLAVLDRFDLIELTIRDAFAAALLVLGLGLVVGTWFGRARWLAIPAAVLLVPGLVVSTTVHELDLPLGSGIGERSFGTTAVGDVDDLYELGVGHLALDFGDLDLDGETVATTARVGLGQIDVRVPDDATVEVTYDVTGGRVDLFGNETEGQPVRGTQVFEGDPGAGRLELTVEAAFGQVEVARASEADFGDVGRRDRFVPFGGAGAGVLSDDDQASSR